MPAALPAVVYRRRHQLFHHYYQSLYHRDYAAAIFPNGALHADLGTMPVGNNDANNNNIQRQCASFEMSIASLHVL